MRREVVRALLLVAALAALAFALPWAIRPPQGMGQSDWQWVHERYPQPRV